MKGGNYLASGIEHNEQGAPTASGEMHAQDEREAAAGSSIRSRSAAICSSSTATPTRRSALISWGSVAGVALEALAAGARRRACR